MARATKTGGAATRPRPAARTKEDKWLAMAKAMDQAIDYMRDLYGAFEFVDGMQGDGKVEIVFSRAELQRVKEKIALVAAELKRGLKARS